MPTSAWFVGSYPNMTAQDLEVTVTATQETCTITAGDYYLDHPTSSLSLCDALATALNTHSLLSGVTCWLGRDRLIHVDGNGTSFSATWTDTDARDMLGFAGNLSPTATSHDATLVSDYLWVPDRPENPTARLSDIGYTVYDTVVSSSGNTSATIVASQHDSRVWNEFKPNAVPNAYYNDGGSALGGQWVTFYDTVVCKMRRFWVYRNYTHNEASTTDVNFSAAGALGPYKYRPASGALFMNEHNRKIANVEQYHDVTLPVVQVSEYA